MKFWQIVITQSEIIWKPSRTILVVIVSTEFLLLQNVIILLNLIDSDTINGFIVFFSFIVVVLLLIFVWIVPRIIVSLPKHKFISRKKSKRIFGLGNVWFLINDKEYNQYEVLIYEPKSKINVFTFVVNVSEIKEIFYLFRRFTYTNHGFWMKQSGVLTSIQQSAKHPYWYVRIPFKSLKDYEERKRKFLIEPHSIANRF